MVRKLSVVVSLTDPSVKKMNMIGMWPSPSALSQIKTDAETVVLEINSMHVGNPKKKNMP